MWIKLLISMERGFPQCGEKNRSAEAGQQNGLRRVPVRFRTVIHEGYRSGQGSGVATGSFLASAVHLPYYQSI